MFFEGSEKKIEIIVEPNGRCLRSLGRDFWAKVVAKANATLLSSLHNDVCDAYLLSESSLFVWKDRFLMLTCGCTTLMDAVVFFLKEYSPDKVLFACYQRKNEYLPQLQKSSFEQDIQCLGKYLPGKAMRLGDLDSHHLFLYHTSKAYQPDANDRTCELLMYHIQGEVAEYLRGDGQALESLREKLEIYSLLPGFQVDDHLFEPFGYSLNAIQGELYATMHITPQSNNSYVSFETNLDLSRERTMLFSRLLDIFQPRTWDLMSFNCKLGPKKPSLLLGTCDFSLDCGYEIHFSHYQDLKRNEMPIHLLGGFKE